MARCPECNTKLERPPDLELWDHLFCESCGMELEAVGLNPLELEVVYDFDEDEADDLDELEEEDDLDWEDDDDDDDDEW